jgi:hypothetical protein
MPAIVVAGVLFGVFCTLGFISVLAIAKAGSTDD